MRPVCTMTRDEFVKPVEHNGRRGYTGLQLASSPTLRAFVKLHPQWFEPGPVYMDIVYIREQPDGTTWVDGLGGSHAPHLEKDADGLPYAGFKAIGEQGDVYVSDGKRAGYKSLSKR